MLLIITIILFGFVVFKIVKFRDVQYDKLNKIFILYNLFSKSKTELIEEKIVEVTYYKSLKKSYLVTLKYYESNEIRTVFFYKDTNNYVDNYMKPLIKK